jgi:hypothetical protein
MSRKSKLARTWVSQTHLKGLKRSNSFNTKIQRFEDNDFSARSLRREECASDWQPPRGKIREMQSFHPASSEKYWGSLRPTECSVPRSWHTRQSKGCLNCQAVYVRASGKFGVHPDKARKLPWPLYFDGAAASLPVAKAFPRDPIILTVGHFEQLDGVDELVRALQSFARSSQIVADINLTSAVTFFDGLSHVQLAMQPRRRHLCPSECR